MRRSKASYFIEILIHVVFWLGVYYALKALTASSFQLLVNNGNGINMTQDGRILFPYGWVVVGFLVLLFYTTGFWLFKMVMRYPGNLRRVMFVAGWLAIIYALNYFAIRLLAGTPRHWPLPVPGLLHGGSLPLTSFSADNWWGMQPIIALIFILLLGVAAAYFFIGEWIRNELMRSQAEAYQASTELRFLRSQVNPHFLFNTLNNLFSLAQREGKDNLADRIAKLSGMMRYMLYESSTDSVPLVKEIGCLEDCISLHQMRYAGNEVDVSFLYPEPEAVAAVQVAPMLFIPFLENAFKHGVVIGRRSYIALTISVNLKKLVFTCENTDHGTVKKLEEEKGGIGLENIKRRLELVYPGRHELHAGPEDGKYIVNLQIDLP